MAKSGSTEIVRSTPSDRVTKSSLEELGVNTDLGTRYELKGKNVLNKYRSLNYVFTLAALSGNYLENPNAYRKGELDLVVLRSGGKGTKGLSSDSSANVGEVGVNTDQTLSGGFNSRSPGRFDLFIENVEIETYMSYQDGCIIVEFFAIVNL